MHYEWLEIRSYHEMTISRINGDMFLEKQLFRVTLPSLFYRTVNVCIQGQESSDEMHEISAEFWVYLVAE